MRFLAFALLALLAAPAAAEPLRFAALGDFPYCRANDAAGCAAEIARVDAMVDAVNGAAPAFSIFVGDSKAGGELCTDAIVVDRTARWFGRFAGALVYTPGDNEWTDCWQDRAGRFDALERLALLRTTFFPGPRSLGQASIPLLRQAEADPAHPMFVENARWAQDGVVFATLHIPGSNNNRPTEADEAPRFAPPYDAGAEHAARDAANLVWLAATFAEARRSDARAVVLSIQADMFYRDRCGRGQYRGFTATRAALEREVTAFGKPVLLIHGDSHFFLSDRPLAGVPNLYRLMVPGAQDIRAVLVTVDPAATSPFEFSLIGAADRAAGPEC